jgi:uncharacterized membrane protein YhaH (DUF805 family)
MQFEIDPLLVSLVLSLLVALRMSAQEKELSEKATNRAGILVMLWVFCLVLLYLPFTCVTINRWCQVAIDMRTDFVTDYLRNDLLGYLSTASILVGSTIRLSGTSSRGWKRVSNALFLIFVAALLIRFIVLPILSAR